MERRALYNALRMNWLLDPKLQVQPWQVTDYRTVQSDQLLAVLARFKIQLDENSFLSFAESFDTPEDLTDALLVDFNLNSYEEDHVYLAVFELWRRLLPEKLSVSIFCDELDYQMFLYDSEHAGNEEAIQDMIANLEILLEDYVDKGYEPIKIFNIVCEHCANDLENFLYDYIGEQIDLGNDSYALDLTEKFSDYVQNAKWLDYYQVRLLARTDSASASILASQLVQEAKKEHDLEFNFSLLGFLVQHGDNELFVDLVCQTLPLLESEEDFAHLLGICADYFHLLDKEHQEIKVQNLIKKRESKNLRAPLGAQDPDFAVLKQILS